MRIVFIQKIIDKFRKKKIKEPELVYVSGINNEVQIPQENKNNIVVQIFGNNNKVIIKTKEFFRANIYIGLPEIEANNCEIYIDDTVWANGINLIRMCEDNSKLHIGTNSVFSSNIDIYISDTHTIINENSEVINIGKSVEIGEHCWICQDVKILKNSKISNNTVVGLGAIVAGKFDKPNCIIAGNPARVIKENVNWSKLRPKQYMQQQNL